MSDALDPPNDTKQVFRECGTCSQTFGHLLNREFGHPMDTPERALTPLAGGIKNHGHQCGMLWGATLAVGAEAYRRHDNTEEATASAIAATQRVVASFEHRTSTLSCREITGRKLDSVFGLVRFMLDTMVAGIDNSPCFALAEAWTPEAIEAARDGLSESPPELGRPALSCASRLVEKMGGSEEEAVMVAGFAGGLGLSGNACGALGAALWMNSLAWARDNPGKTPGLWTDTGEKNTLKVFNQVTGSEFSCRDICGRSFATTDEHSAHVEDGGCEQLLDALAGA